MIEKIIACAKRYDADIVGFAPADRFSADDPIFKIFPGTKTVIGLGFRVLRGIYRGVEEGTTYYQYTTMGVENLEETVMPLTLLNVSNLIEEEGFIAVPQRKSPLIQNELEGTNPEVDFNDVYRGVKAENQLDFLNCAVQCGLGEKSMIGSLLTDDYGPFIRYCFILTDAELPATELAAPHLCDNCGECIKACPGNAISEDGLDTWQCSVYYKGAHKSNIFMKEDFLAGNPEREAIINGEKRFDAISAREIYPELKKFLPPFKGYAPCLCGKRCDIACYKHLKEIGKI